ncbi:Kinesin light chain 3 [Irineochytrium annulatum]|nr:Kinesin light chain 3 [Irineochytrium annulatum]
MKLVAAVRKFFADRQQDPQDVYIWLDLFSNCQHDTASKPFVWWENTFLMAVKRIRNVVMVVQPWNDPVVLRRAWCVFEVFACVTTGSDFHVAMSPKEAANFSRGIRQDPGSFYNMLSKISAERSESFLKNDRAMICETIRRSAGGFNRIDSMIVRIFGDWLTGCLKSFLASADGDLEASDLAAALGSVLEDQGYLQEAVPFLEDCLKYRRRVRKALVEDMDQKRLWTAMGNLALVYQSLGRHEDARPLFVECQERMTAELGEAHPDAMAALNNLATFYADVKDYEAAEPLLEKCLDLRLEVLGEDHRDTMESVNNLAFLYRTQEKYDLAKPVLKRCLNKTTSLLGEDHPDTLTAMNNYARLLHAQDLLDDAEPIYRECLERRRKVLGDEHPSTATSMANLASLYYHLGNLDPAEALLKECLETRRSILGETHQDTLRTVTTLADLYEAREDWVLAEPMFRLLYEGKLETLGEDDEETQEALEEWEKMKEMLRHS